MQKIRRLSIIFRVLFQFGFIITPMLSIAFWVYYPSYDTMSIFGSKITIGLNINGSNLYPSNIEDRFIGFLISSLPMICTEMALLLAIKLFKLFEQGKLFLLQTARYMGRIAFILLIREFLVLLSDQLINSYAIKHGHLNQKIINIGSYNLDFSLLFYALFIMLISWIMIEGHKLQEQQEYTV